MKVWIAMAIWMAPFGCSDRSVESRASAARRVSASTDLGMPSSTTAPSSDASSITPPATTASAAAPRLVAARAPSLAMSSPIDGRDERALSNCESLRTGQAKQSESCGEHDPPPIDVDRFDASALPIDPETRAHLVAVAKRGKTLGLNPRAFGLVGDSITVSLDFLSAFATGSHSPVEIDPLLRDRLALSDGTSIIDFFRGAPVEERDGVVKDPFTAERAAKVGARAPWALDGGDVSPVATLVERLHPAIVVLAYGANDAAFRTAPPEDLADEFERNIGSVIAALESRGVVVILENEMRHGDQPGVKACPHDDPRVNDWRLAVATNATSARAAEVAAKRHLPFVDLRFALDLATNHGLGPDAVHPSVHKKGGGVFTREGLDCGYDIRNLVTLMELARVVRVLEEGELFPSGPATASRTGGEVTTRPAK